MAAWGRHNPRGSLGANITFFIKVGVDGTVWARCDRREGSTCLDPLPVLLNDLIKLSWKQDKLLLAKGLIGLNGRVDLVHDLCVESVIAVKIHVVLRPELVDEKPWNVLPLSRATIPRGSLGHRPCKKWRFWVHFNLFYSLQDIKSKAKSQDSYLYFNSMLLFIS